MEIVQLYVSVHGVVAGAQRVLSEVVHLWQLGAQAGHELGLARDVLHGAEDALPARGGWRSGGRCRAARTGSAARRTPAVP